jgi:hypothetical protein
MLYLHYLLNEIGKRNILLCHLNYVGIIRETQTKIYKKNNVLNTGIKFLINLTVNSVCFL